MNCKVVQRRLLSIDNPAETPADVQAHLTLCEACQEWQNNLSLIEHHVPFLPVPRSRRKTRFLREFLAPAAPTIQEITPVSSTGAAVPAIAASLPAARESQKWWTRYGVAAGVAAALLLILFAQWRLRTADEETKTAPARASGSDPLLANLLQRDLRLAKAETPRQRMEILADVAEDLHDETRNLSLAPEAVDLDILARLYEQVVKDGILRQAQSMPAVERKALLISVADRLGHTARAMDRLAQKAPANQARPFRVMQRAAIEGNRHLHELLAEVKS